MKYSEIKAGDVIVADGGFTCIEPGTACRVGIDLTKRLYVDCRKGRHYLEAQRGPGDELVGFAQPAHERPPS